MNTFLKKIIITAVIATFSLLPVAKAHAGWAYIAADVPYTVGDAGAMSVDAGADQYLPQPQAGLSITGVASSPYGSITKSTWSYIGCTPSCTKPGIVLTPTLTNTGTHQTSVVNMDGAAVGTHFTYQYTAVDSANNSASDTMDVIITGGTGTNLKATYLSPTNANPGSLTLNGEVNNVGSDVTNASFTSYFEVMGNGTLTWTSPAITLNGGETKSVSATRSFSSGVYQVRLCADGAGTVTETNEGDNCSDPVTLTVAGSTAGSCGLSKYTCGAGTPTNTGNNGTNYTWTCEGTGGGADKSCSSPMGIDGMCSTTPNQCIQGSVINTSEDATTYSWTCTGSGTGSDKACIETKNNLPDCSDGKDNDGDGRSDFGNDPGCTSATDKDENDPKPIYIEL